MSLLGGEARAGQAAGVKAGGEEMDLMSLLGKQRAGQAGQAGQAAGAKAGGEEMDLMSLLGGAGKARAAQPSGLQEAAAMRATQQAAQRQPAAAAEARPAGTADADLLSMLGRARAQPGAHH